MGLVYLCVDHAEEGRPVALKTFRPELLPDRAARDRFLREGTTWVQLGKHPHIVRCHQVFKADVGPEVFFVLELVAVAEGKRDASLRSWLTPGKPLSIKQALLFALHIARGMKQRRSI
jgi:serine/threonine protein kinase